MYDRCVHTKRLTPWRPPPPSQDTNDVGSRHVSSIVSSRVTNESDVGALAGVTTG